MRSPDDRNQARLRCGLLTLSLGTVLAGCSGAAGNPDIASASQPFATQHINGPAADYPLVIGSPYYVGDTEYVPEDTLNYDHVGYLAVDDGAIGYSGAHHTLPLPSYAEVTALDSGRTILVRLERRGPMDSNHLIALSPAALAQLQAGADTPVRVRRVVPPEEQRFLLRAGQAAPLRMDTPTSLLGVLQRRLPAAGAASLSAQGSVSRGQAPGNGIQTVDLAASTATPAPAIETPGELPVMTEAPRENATEAPALRPLQTVAENSSEAEAQPSFAEAFTPADTDGEEQIASAQTDPAPAEPEAPRVVANGRFVVQAAAFSTRERAERVARAIGGEVTQAGRFFRVRTGPFATRGEAEASLANVRRAGYTDARIFTNS